MLAEAYGPGLWFLWVVLVWGFVAFFFWRRRRWWRDPSTWGEAVLCARYARGEITEEEYRERLRFLKENRRPGRAR